MITSSSTTVSSLVVAFLWCILLLSSTTIQNHVVVVVDASTVTLSGPPLLVHKINPTYSNSRRIPFTNSFHPEFDFNSNNNPRRNKQNINDVELCSVSFVLFCFFLTTTNKLLNLYGYNNNFSSIHPSFLSLSLSLSLSHKGNE